MMHKTLERQVRKFLAVDSPMPKNMKNLLDDISRTYDGYDKDRTLLERSLEISSNELNEINKKLKREADNFRKYLDIAGVMIVVIGRDRKVRLINRKGCEILEYDEKYIVGRNWFDFLPKKNRDATQKAFDDLVASKGRLVERYENPVATKSGKTRLIEWHNTVLIGDDGKIEATMSSGEDITEQKKSEETLKRSNEELEKFNKLMIGRELKMIELKKELERLKH